MRIVSFPFTTKLIKNDVAQFLFTKLVLGQVFKSQLLFKFIYWDINKLLGFLPARPGFDIYETNPLLAGGMVAHAIRGQMEAQYRGSFTLITQSCPVQVPKQGHQATVFCKISVQRSTYCLEFSIT